LHLVGILFPHTSAHFTTVRYQQQPRLKRQIHDINELLLCVIASNFRIRISLPIYYESYAIRSHIVSCFYFPTDSNNNMAHGVAESWNDSNDAYSVQRPKWNMVVDCPQSLPVNFVWAFQ